MEKRRLLLNEIVENKGQIDGLPKNPRKFAKVDVERLANSIRETPELLEARGLLVYPHNGKYVVIGGNLRLRALQHIDAMDAPCIILPEDTPVDKLKEIAIKDNGAFGEWDNTLLEDEWGDLPLGEWGIPDWEPSQDEEPKDLNGTLKDKPFVVKITFKNADMMMSFVETYKSQIEKEYSCIMSESGGEL